MPENNNEKNTLPGSMNSTSGTGLNPSTANPPAGPGSSTTVPSTMVPPINPLDDNAKGAQIGVMTPPVNKKVEVDADVLQRLIDGQEKMKEELSILRGASDKGRLDRVESLRSKGKLVKEGSINEIDGRLIKGWVRVKDDVYFDEQGRLHEDQQIKLFFFDEGEDKLISDRHFARTKKLVVGEVVSESKDRDGNVVWKILMPNGEYYELDVKYVN